MSSQPGNLQDLAAYSGYPPSFITGSEAEPDSLSRQDFAQHSTLPSDMGLRYMTIPVSDDAQFGSESGTSHTSVYSNESSNPTSTSSTIPFPFPNVFHPGLSGSVAHSHIGSSFFSPNASNYCMPDIKPVLKYHGSNIRPILGYQNNLDIKPYSASFSPSPVMAPPSRSPHLPHLGSPVTARELYTGVTPQLRRASDLISRSPSASSTMRGPPISPSSSSGFASPANMENSQLSSNAGPPLQPTENIFSLQTSDGQPVRSEILGKIDKGFFMADNDWTCYRRNYFQLSCSYTLHPFVPTSNIRLIQNGSAHQVHAFAMSIAAVVDGRDGRSIELVQHTPKRDKGPQAKPERVTLAPRPHPSAYASVSGETGLGPGSRSLYDQGYGQNPSQPQTECTFERIQFKCATANNGRRRAAQQYYHLLVELCVDIGAQMGDARWIKVAHRVSAPVVVRGRSPGHYHSERRQSNASAGGSAGPGGNGGSYNSNSGISRGPLDQVSMSGSSIVPGGGYADAYQTRSHHYLQKAHIDLPVEPIMSADEIKAIDESEGYLYFPSPLYEGTGMGLPHMRSHLGPLNQRDERTHGVMYERPGLGPKIKQESGSYGGYNLPSLTAGPPADSLGRHFGRFDGLSSSRGYYPTVFTSPAVNSL